MSNPDWCSPNSESAKQNYLDSFLHSSTYKESWYVLPIGFDIKKHMSELHGAFSLSRSDIKLKIISGFHNPKSPKILSVVDCHSKSVRARNITIAGIYLPLKRVVYDKTQGRLSRSIGPVPHVDFAELW